MPATQPRTHVAARVEMARVAELVAGANRSAIHRATGISLSGVSRILSGSRVASSRNLLLIASEIGVSMDALYRYLTGLRLKENRRVRRGRPILVPNTAADCR